MTERFNGQKVAILGFGAEGQSSARYFAKHGAIVTVFDRTAEGAFAGVLPAFHDQEVTFELGQEDFGSLEKFDLVVRSPGLTMDHPSLRGIPSAKVTSQTQLFLSRWRDRSIGITGTKGKGTTSTLLAGMLETAGKKVLIGGNIGVPMLDLLEQMDDETWAVLELSSFQLMDVTVSPHIAVVLRIEPEHLNWHKDVAEYVAAKGRLLEFQRPEDRAVLFADAPLTASLQEKVQGRLSIVSQHPVEEGAQIDEDRVLLCGDGQCRVLVELDQLRLRGRHNLENVAAAAVVAQLLTVPDKVICRAACAYQPLPHRLELVATREGIDFYNDSFSTTPEAAAAAIRSFREPLVVIVGGSDKGVGFEPVATALRQASSLVGVIVIGAVTDKILSAIDQSGGVTVPVIPGLTLMPEMVARATDLLRDKDHGVILLSPGAASFGLFHDYKDRGEQFRAAATRV